jgi:hypothetical protein
MFQNPQKHDPGHKKYMMGLLSWALGVQLLSVKAASTCWQCSKQVVSFTCWQCSIQVVSFTCWQCSKQVVSFTCWQCYKQVVLHLLTVLQTSGVLHLPARCCSSIQQSVCGCILPVIWTLILVMNIAQGHDFVLHVMKPTWCTIYLQFIESLHLCMFRACQ